MKIAEKWITVLIAVTLTSPCFLSIAQKKATAQPSRDYPVKPVPFTAVHFNDVFWAPRIETNRTVTIPFAFQKCEETGRLDNFRARVPRFGARRSRTPNRPAIRSTTRISTR